MMDRQTDGWIQCWINSRIDRQKGGWIYRQTDICMDTVLDK